MPPREDTLIGWPAPAAFAHTPASEPPAGAPPSAAVAAAPPDVPIARATLWRRTRARVPAPRPRGRPVAVLALEPRAALGIADFHELRREGLFGDDGRNPPPSWWAR